MITRAGELVLVDASPDGYVEVVRTPVLEAGNYAIPSFSDDRFLIRNLTQLVAVRVDTSLAPQVAAVDESDRLHGAFGEWVAALEKLETAQRQTAVDSYFREVAATPLFGENGWAHLVWRGHAADVGVPASFLPDGEDRGLYSVAGTDLFFRSLELRAGGPVHLQLHRRFW